MDLLEETKAVLKSLVISSPRQLTTHQLNKHYIEVEGHTIPFHKLGYSNLRSFLCSMPDTIKVNLHSDVVAPVLTNGSGSQHIYKLVSQQQTSNRYRPRTSSSYQQRTQNRRIDYSSKFNDDRLSERMRHLELKPSSVNKINSVEKEGQKESKVINGLLVIDNNVQSQPPKIVTTGGAGIFSKEDYDEEKPKIIEAVPLLDYDDSIQSIGLHMYADTKIPNAILSNIKPGGSYNISVSEINRPWRFWFQLSEKLDVENFEDQLGWHYHDDKNLIMNKSDMTVGNACVVFYLDKWFRAEFIRQPFDDKIKVCLVDYGTIVVLNVSRCRYIHNDFCSVPKLCYTGALEFIHPIDNHDIELKLVHNFCKMAYNKALVGVVTKIDLKNSVVHLVAVNTLDETKDVIINKQLLDIQTKMM